jgi:Ser/Thr protein kinase RdoA (MazF antagonist)
MKLSKSVESWKREVAAKAAAILQGLPSPLGITSLTPVSASSWNALFQGSAAARRYCVKVMNEETVPMRWDRDELEYSARAVTALASAGLQYIAPPVPLRGERCVLRCAGYTLSVFPWHESIRGPGGSVEFSRAAGALYKIHACGRQFARDEAEPETRFTRKYGPAAWARSAEQIWDESERDLAAGGAGSEVIATLRRARCDGIQFTNRFQKFFSASSQEHTLLHGDYRPENVSIEDGSARLIFDFDFLRRGPPEEDVAYAALACSGSGWFCGPCDWESCARFVRSYQKSACAARSGLLRVDFLEAALYWTLLKELSLSFRSAEVQPRYALFCDLQSQMARILAAVEAQ